MSTPPRKRRSTQWPEFEVPRLIPLTGFRDTAHRITYLPWGDARTGIVGWEIWADRSQRNTLVYIVPKHLDDGAFEIRCHVTWKDPDPDNDELLGEFRIPKEVLDPDE